MSDLDYSTLKVGQYVAVSSTASWRTRSEGIYRVVEANKIKVVLVREDVGLTREFSVKRRVEVGDSASPWSRAFIESVADMEKREAQYAAERERKQLWVDAEQAAREKNLTKLSDIVNKLSQLAV